jgi:AcrR family transcriptional regulator
MSSRVAPRARLHTDKRKRQIVQVVLQLVADQGVDSVSTQRIADTIGFTQGAVFRHFSTKEQVWSAVMDWLEEQLEAVWSEARLQGEDQNEIPVLKRMFLGHIELIERHPGLVKLIMSDHIRHQFPVFQERFAALHRRYEREVRQAINAGVRDAKLPKLIDREAAVTLFLCAIQGLAFQFSIARVKPALRKDAARVYKLFVGAVGLDSSKAAVATSSSRKLRRRGR